MLRVWNIINPPNQPLYYPVETPEAGAQLIDELAAAQLIALHVIANAFGLEVLEDGEWTEWYSEDGLDVSEAFGEIHGAM